MRYTWLFILVPFIIAAIVILRWTQFRKKSKKRNLRRVAIISHTKTVKQLPAYRRAVLQYKLLLAGAAVSFLVAAFAFTGVIARPISSTIQKEEYENRDVILCMDVSGSMDRAQKQMLGFYRDAIKGLEGQRVGIVIYNGIAESIIPLSNDYDAVDELIQHFYDNYDTYTLVLNPDDRASAIGDGGVACAKSFTSLEDETRSRSIIMVTDNEPYKETIDINQAARYMKRYNITMYGVHSGSCFEINGKKIGACAKFENAVKITGGSFYQLKNEDSYMGESTYQLTGSSGYTSGSFYKADSSNNENDSIVDNIVKKILDQEAAKIEGAPEPVYYDTPVAAIIVASISFVIFGLIIWRLRL